MIGFRKARTALAPIAVAGALLAPAGALFAQGPGGGTPTLDLEGVTVIKKRNVVLPKARKGEVLDTATYALADGDTLLFAERLSNLGGPGGALPRVGEFDPPLALNAEASVGTYISPRAAIRAEYVRGTFDVNALMDFRTTSGHTTGAGSTGILMGAGGSVSVGAENSPLGRFRLSAAVEHADDDYTLYGNAVAAANRSRTSSRVSIAMRNEEAQRVHYGLEFGVTGTSVVDVLGPYSAEASALTPAVTLNLGTEIDSGLAADVRFGFSSTSLRYTTTAQTPAAWNLLAQVDWHAAERLTITGGLTFANAQRSDSGSSNLIAPLVAVQYEVDERMQIFGWFAPELRAASYNDRIMTAPYVARDVALIPERVPVRLAAAVRLRELLGESSVVELRMFYESTENTPVVTRAAEPGTLAWTSADARIAGATLTTRVQPLAKTTVNTELTLRTATAGGEQLPMTPFFDLRARGDYNATEAINLYATATFQSAQRTMLVDTTSATSNQTSLDPRILLGCGAAYQAMRNLQAFVEITNLLAHRYDLWHNYSAPGIEARGGIRITL